MVKKHNYPLVEVTWKDSFAHSGWQSKPDPSPLECYTAGYLVHRDKRSVVIALNSSSTESNNSFGDTITIPMGMVKRVRRLK